MADIHILKSTSSDKLGRDDISYQVERARFGGDDGGGGGMEARVKHLEEDMAEIKSDMKVVRSELSELKGKVSMLPGYPGITVIMALVGGALMIVSRLFPSISP